MSVIRTSFNHKLSFAYIRKWENRTQNTEAKRKIDPKNWASLHIPQWQSFTKSSFGYFLHTWRNFSLLRFSKQLLTLYTSLLKYSCGIISWTLKLHIYMNVQNNGSRRTNFVIGTRRRFIDSSRFETINHFSFQLLQFDVSSPFYLQKHAYHLLTSVTIMQRYWYTI